MSASSLPRLAPPPGRRIGVAGGAGGIGRAVVSALLAAGCRVGVLDLPASLARHPPPAGVAAYPFDATQEPAVAAAFAALDADWGGLDGFVSLAGFTLARQPLGETGKAQWDEVIAGNLDSMFLVCRAALPLLRRGEAPALVTASSGLALKATPGYGPYAVAKAGILAMTRLLAQENAPAIRVNAVAPSAVDTAFLRGGTGRGGEADAAGARLDMDAYIRTIPLQRLAVPEDIVGPILFLLGPASGYITGQTLHINGGSLMP